MNDKARASEYLYGFVSWITCQENFVVGREATPEDIIDHLCEFINVNNLQDPRNNFTDYFEVPERPAITNIKRT